ncbi:ABC transporter substrate-binding protein [Desulfolutivibrio sulfoxidireducens]|uniref:ABC transporter substrate-binding protein n=1 Tax=Desulfolutivibrio sulfoxidireducens TaxID=2773299 RepID=UPI0021091DC5|nr:ABC transporter substrate-binding protein [Desulfolutivibrio sulfoxidireducens]
MKPTTFASVRAAVILALLLAMAGCAGLEGPEESGRPPKPPTAAQDPRFAEADAAWQAGRHEQSRNLYSLLMNQRGLPKDLKLLAVKRSALSALFMGDFKAAQPGLDAWRAADPAAAATWEWNYRYAQTLSGLGRDDQAREHLGRLISENRVPWLVQAEAAIDLFLRHAKGGDAAAGVRLLAEVHRRGTDPAAVAKMEEYLAKNLGSLPDPALAKCDALVSEANLDSFPYNLVALERARRAALTAADKRPWLRELADRLGRAGELADRTLPQRILNKGLEGLAASSLVPVAQIQAPPAGQTVAVLLPLGGQFREFGGKVVKGIQAGQAELSQAGTPVEVTVIDVTQPDWLTRLQNLPPDVTLVGGPMHRISLQELHSSGLVPGGRVYLMFMPTLGEALHEGADAWRFFSSPKDEIDALLNLSLGNFGIRHYGLLRPEDRYGQAMGELFALETARLGGQVTATGIYSPADATGWDVAVQQMLQQAEASGGFGAVFIPDDWNRSDGVLPYFFHNKVEDLLIMGPQLWTEALTRAAATKTSINIQNYRLAVCPGAWWSDNTAPAAQELVRRMRTEGQESPDFWVALGYDFIRMAAKLGPIPPNPAPGDVSTRLAQAAASMQWSMAPLSYDPSGQVHQSMFLFRPSVAGPVPLDPEGFRERLNTIRGRAGSASAPETESSYLAPREEQSGMETAPPGDGLSAPVDPSVSTTPRPPAAGVPPTYPAAPVYPAGQPVPAHQPATN